MQTPLVHKATIILVYILTLLIFSPLLLPLVLPDYSFSFGDLTSAYNQGSADFALIRTIFPYESFQSLISYEYMRYSPIFSLFLALAKALSFGESFAWSAMILLSVNIGYWGLYKLYRRYANFNRGLNYIFFAFLVLFYFLNFYSVTRVIHLFTWIIYPVLPAMIYQALQMTEKLKISKLLLYSLIISTFGVIPHGIFYMMVIHGLLALLMFFFVDKNRAQRALVFGIVPVIIYLLMNPHFLAGLVVDVDGYPIRLTLDQLQFLSHNGSVKNTLSFSNIWLFFFEPTKMYDNKLYIYSGLAISAISAIGASIAALMFLIKQRWRDAIFVLTLMAVSVGIIVLSSGLNSETMVWIAESLDSSGRLGILSIFREWARIAILLPVIYLLFYIFLKFRGVNIKFNNTLSFTLVFLFVINLAASPVIPYISKYYAPVKAPEEYSQLIEEIPKDQKVLWLYPNNAENINNYEAQQWDLDKTANLLENQVGTRYSYFRSGQPESYRYFQENEASEELLRTLNFGKIIKRKDYVTTDGAKFSNYAENAGFTTFNKYFDIRDLSASSSRAVVISDPQYVYLPSRDISLIDALYKAGYNPVPVEDSAQADFLVNDLGKSSLTAQLDQYVIDNPDRVFDAAKLSNRTDPFIYWSSGSTENPIHYEFNSFLYPLGIRNYQDDYERNVLFTMAEPMVDAEYDLNNTEPFIVRDYKNAPDQMEISARNPITNSSEYSYKIEQGLPQFSLNLKRNSWSIIKLAEFTATKGEYIRGKVELKLKDVWEPHLKAVFYNSKGEQVSDRYLTSLADFTNGEFNEFTFDAYVSSNDVTKVEIQLWHGFESQTAFPNTITAKSLKIYSLNDQAIYPTVQKNLNISEAGEYILVARMLQGSQTSKMEVEVDGTLIEIAATKEAASFDWRSLGTFELDESSDITLRNINGLNAINIILAIPKDDYEALKLSQNDKAQIYKVSPGETKTKLAEGSYKLTSLTDQSLLKINNVDYSSGSKLNVGNSQNEVTIASEGEWLIIPDTFSKSQVQSIQFTSDNPIQLSLDVSNVIPGGSKLLLFNELYDKNWTIYNRVDGKEKTMSPLEVFAGNNGYILPSELSENLRLEYKGAIYITFLKLFSFVYYALLVLLTGTLLITDHSRARLKAK